MTAAVSQDLDLRYGVAWHIVLWVAHHQEFKLLRPFIIQQPE
jgi:hypothetical protein